MFKEIFQGKKNFILIVEDETEPAELLTEFLQLHGYRTRVAADGVAGLEMARRLSPDLVLLDIMLPKMDGMNVLLNLKSDPRTQKLPVVMCTALNGLKEVERCCKWGAEGYVTKPFDLDRVLEKVADTLGKHAQDEPLPPA